MKIAGRLRPWLGIGRNPATSDSDGGQGGEDRFFAKSGPMILGLFLLALSLSGLSCKPLPPASLVIINGPEPESLDPAIITGQADGRVALALFEGLTRYNPVTALPEPGIAERYDLSEDGRTYTFHLRTNAVWSTGERITADDFLYSWRRVLDPKTAAEYSGALFYVKNGEAFATGQIKDPAQIGLRAADPATFIVELAEPTPFFLDLCAFPTLAVVPRQAIEKHGDRWLTALPLPCSGAYQLEFWRLNDRIRLTKNPLYWDAPNTKMDTVDMLPCVSASTALNLYQTKQADIVWDKELVPSELIDLLRQRPDFHSFDYLGTYFLRFNVTRKPFDDPRVRRAFAHATDKERIVKKITRAGERAANHFVPPGLPNYVSPPGLEFNPQRARELLAEAGYPGGAGFPLIHYLYNNTGKSHEQIAIELKEGWKQVLGVNVSLLKLEWKAYLRAQTALDYDISRSSWIGDYNDPNTFLDMFMSNNGNNRTGWKSAEYDRLLRQGNAEMDPSKRSRLLQEAEAMLIARDAPIVPLYIYAGLEYYDPNRIRGVYPNLRSEHPIRAIRKEIPERGAGKQATR